MKLNDVYTKPLKDVVEGLNLTDMKFIQTTMEK